MPVVVPPKFVSEEDPYCPVLLLYMSVLPRVDLAPVAEPLLPSPEEPSPPAYPLPDEDPVYVSPEEPPA